MQKSMKRMLLLVAIFFTLVFGIYGVKKAMFIYFMSHYTPPAVTITAKEVKTKDWHAYLTSVGTLKAIKGVDLSVEVPGTIKEIHFTSGQTVQAGEPLILLDTRVQEAELKNANAALQLAQLSYEREQTLYKRKASSKANLDARFAEYTQAQAKVEAAKAQMNIRTITAPFTGHIGIRLVDIGQYVSPGTALVTLQSLDPLYVMFTMPEQDIPYLHLNQPVNIKINFQDGRYAQGTISAINAKVDEATRNILVQATIPNPDLSLYPGMFATVRVQLPEQKDQLIVPQTAISYSLSGDYVFILKEEDKQLKAYRQYVNVGDRRGNEAVILKGLKPGDRIVTVGQLKLQNGTRVNVDEEKEM